MLQYMQEVDNGFVTGLAYSHDLEEADREVIEEAAYDAEDFLQTSIKDHPEHDYVHEDFSNPSVKVDAVKIDTDLGIVDVIRNGNVSERYTLLGVLDDGDQPDIYMGQDMGGSTQVIRQSDNSIDWNQEKAAAYEAINEYLGVSAGDMNDPEEVGGLVDRSVEAQNYSKANARSAVKKVDRAMARTSDSRVSGIVDFEDIGEVKIDGQDHPFSDRDKGASSFHAARKMDSLLDDLYRMHIIDYKIESLNDNGDEKEATVSIDPEYTEDSVRDEVAAVGDFGEDVDEFVEELVDERYPW